MRARPSFERSAMRRAYDAMSAIKVAPL